MALLSKMVNMPTLAIVFGILLDILGIVGYVWTGSQAPTALIPAVLGTLILILGIIASRNPGLRKHAMHGAALLALLGFLGGAAKALPHIPKMCQSTQTSAPAQMGSPSPAGEPNQMGTPTSMNGTPDQMGALSNQVSTLEHGHHIAFWMQSAMALLCLIFLIACVRSFIAARRGGNYGN